MAIKCICLIGVIILMMTDQTVPHEKFGKASYRDGYWFHFEDGENDITVNASAISGRERIYVNDELVSDKVRWKLKSHHDIDYQGVPYQVRFKVTDILGGKLECAVSKGGTEIEAKTIAFYSGGPGEIALKMLPIFLLGAFFGSSGIMFGRFLAKSEESIAFLSSPFLIGLGSGLAAAGILVFVWLVFKTLKNRS